MEKTFTPSSKHSRHPVFYWVIWVFLAFLMPLVWFILAYLLVDVIVVPTSFIFENGQSSFYIYAFRGVVNVVTGVVEVVTLFTIYAIFQWLVLARFGVSFKSWLLSSFAGMAMGLLLSEFGIKVGEKFLNIDLFNSSPTGSIIIGFLFGSSVALIQSLSLRTISKFYQYWIPANIIAYTCAFLVFQTLWLDAIRVDEEGAGILLYLYLPLTSVIVGVITGFSLIWQIGIFRRIQSITS